MKLSNSNFLLETSRLILRPPKIEDVPTLNEAVLASYSELHQWMEWAGKPQTMKETQEYVEGSLKAWTNPYESSELPVFIFSKEHQLIGSTGFTSIDWKVPCLEIGYWCHSDYTGKGYILETVQRLSDYAVDELKMKRIEIRCDSLNSKSLAIPKKLGFSLEATLKFSRVVPGTRQVSDTLIFSKVN